MIQPSLRASVLSSVLILATQPSHAVLDLNGNGLSDLYEEAVNGGVKFGPTTDLSSDEDHDGLTLAQEAVAGTHPNDPNPTTGRLSLGVDEIPGSYVDTDDDGINDTFVPAHDRLSWTGRPGKRYTLETSSDLKPGSWQPVGQSVIGDGQPVQRVIPPPQHGEPGPTRGFWRVTVADIDSDSDSLTDWEEHLLTTNPGAADSDGDGVSDFVELAENNSNPLLALDSDTDGIPDDLERHLAKQFLAVNPEAEHWGSYFTGLTLGNLDATYDYTGDQMPAAALATALRPTAAARPSPTGVQIELWNKHNLLQGYQAAASPENPGGSVWGTYYYIVPGDYDGEVPLTNASDFTAAYLTSRIDAIPWVQAFRGDLVPFDANYPLLAGHPTVAGFDSVPEGLPPGATSYYGHIYQDKVRLVATRADHDPIDLTYLKITSKRSFSLAQSWGIGQILKVEPLRIVLPKGKFFTEWFEFKAEMTSGQDTQIDLVLAEMNDLKSADANDDQTIASMGSVPIPKAGETEVAFMQRRNAYFQQTLKDGQIAYIDPHRGAQNSPEMPRLAASLVGGPSELKVRWRLEVEYLRGNGYRDTYVRDFTRPEDRVQLPHSSNPSEPSFTAEMNASDEWRVFESLDWQQEIAQRGFFGGTAKAYLWVPSASPTPPTEPFITFRIGGRSPDEARARTYIDQRAGANHWYAYAIAKHETFGRASARFYNHFYTDYRGPANRIGANANDMGWVAWAKGWPLYNLDRSYGTATGYRQNGPGGDGLFQYTPGPSMPAWA